MKRYKELVAEYAEHVRELFPWDLLERMEENPDLLLLDVREPYEFDAMHIRDSINVPRGILESACEYDYEETVPELVEAREREIAVICRSGYRSVMAAYIMQELGYRNVFSLYTGLRGWNDYEQPMLDAEGNEIDIDDADEYFEVRLAPEQIDPGRR